MNAEGNDRGGLRGRVAGLTRTGTLGAGVLVVAALLGMVNYFGWKYHARLDWTATKLYSLSEKTENVLKGLGRDVDVTVFVQPGDQLYEPTREILSRYEAASSHVKLRFLDAGKNPLEAKQLAEKYDVKSASVVFTAGGDRQVVQRDALADLDYSGVQLGRTPEIRGFKGEQLFTAALIDLANPKKPKVLFTTGHGEHKLDDLSPAGLGEAQRLLKDDNFDLQEWSSLGAKEVPSDTDLVVVAGPTSTFVPPELAMFTAYLDRGGRMLLLLDPVISQVGKPEVISTGLEDWLAAWGLKLGNDVVIDPGNPLPFFGAETLFVTDYGEHAVTHSVREGELPVLVSLARSVGAHQAPAGFEATDLLRTSRQGWGETDLTNPHRDDTDLRGPVPLGVAVEGTAKAAKSDDGEDEEAADLDETAEAKAAAADAKAGAPDAGEAKKDDGGAKKDDTSKPASKMRLVVYGDSDFATDRLLQANVANGVLLADTLNWLTERQTLLGIPPKKPEQVRLSLTASALTWVRLFALAILPGLAVVFGVLVYTRRRR